MRISPQTEQQVMEAGLLPAGQYGFTINRAEEKISSKGNPMIALELEVYDVEGKSHGIKDWIMEAVPYKLRHFAYAVGLGNRYEAGDLNAQELQGLSGECIIKVEPAEGNYSAKNSVKDYVKRVATGAPEKPAARTVQREEIDPNSPPF